LRAHRLGRGNARLPNADASACRDCAPRRSRSFRQARTFARSLGLKSSTAWFDYCRSGEKPTDIPYNPQFTYAEAGWAGYGDWLGTGRGAPGTFRSFKLARKYVHRLGLKSRTQWNEYCASGKKPADIPAAPQAVYAEAGWAGHGDWLKTGMVATHLRLMRLIEGNGECNSLDNRSGAAICALMSTRPKLLRPSYCAFGPLPLARAASFQAIPTAGASIAKWGYFRAKSQSA
jgi:hypothetical protein